MESDALALDLHLPPCVSDHDPSGGRGTGGDEDWRVAVRFSKNDCIVTPMQEHWSVLDGDARSLTSRLRRAAGVAVLAMAVMTGCADRRDVPGADESVALVPMDTLVSTASELVGGIYDLTVSPDGDVYVADYSYKHVLVVGSDGAVRRRIGRQGRGPGEFDMPFAVFAGTDSVRVLDAARNEVQVFDGAGVLARGYRLDVPGVGGGRVFRDDGSLAATIDGFEQAMVMVLDASGRRVGRFGEPIVPPVTSYDFTALKSAIQDGRVPDAFRNRATLAWSADHSLYLVFLAEPQVRRYDPAGSLIWTRTFDEPALHAAREEFVRKNAQEQNSARIHPLQYVTDAEVVAGDLWLLLNTADDDEGLLLILNAHDGAVRRRVTFPGLANTGYFAVDLSRGRMYMAPRGEASILIFELPRS